MRLEPSQLVIAGIIHMSFPARIDDNRRERLFDDGRTGNDMAGTEMLAKKNRSAFVTAAKIDAS